MAQRQRFWWIFRDGSGWTGTMDFEVRRRGQARKVRRSMMLALAMGTAQMVMLIYFPPTPLRMLNSMGVCLSLAAICIDIRTIWLIRRTMQIERELHGFLHKGNGATSL
jgi:hypothetical protein